MTNKLIVDQIWWRNVQPGEFYNIERHPQIEGGGGAQYIEIPSSMVPDTLEFLGHGGADVNSFPEIKLNARAIGGKSEEAIIEFQTKQGGRMRISRQNRQAPKSQRHPAWTEDFGFPKAHDHVKSTDEAKQYLPNNGLRIFIVKTVGGEYYAGFTSGLASNHGMEDAPWNELYSQGISGGVIQAKGVDNNRIGNILDSWGFGRNVLLYGPPATGKTRLISELFQTLNTARTSGAGILLDPDDRNNPLTKAEDNLIIPKPIKVVWTTFHQSYGYEDFVLGLRPEITAAGTRLLPWAGVFLDAALELNDPSSEYQSVVIIIDEINRGNAARIFGEFMTFLDFDYRHGGRVPLPVPLRQLRYENGWSEEIYRPGGETATIPQEFLFPENVYIVATMNSVDRAAVPIDSALARRFDRIEMRPDLEVLAQHWGMEIPVMPVPTDSNWETLSPFQTGYLILDRLNVAIASDLGSEFELGHGLLTPMLAHKTEPEEPIQPVESNIAWRKLAKIWDDVLFPQLEDRYSGRPEQLVDLLRADAPPESTYAWTLRTAMGGMIEAKTLAPVRVSELDIEVIKRSFRWLTR